MNSTRKIMDIIEQNRARKRMSMQELADLTGMSRASISRYKNGSREFPINHAHKFAEVLGISTSELLGMNDIESNNIKSVINGLDEKNRDSLYEYARFLYNSQSRKD